MTRLTIIVPVYNEVLTIEEILRRVLAFEQEGIEKEVLVVDDGSTDGTRETLEQIAREHADVRVLLQPQNRGKGAAVWRGIQEATGDLLLVQDADLEYDPRDYSKLIQPILDGVADVVYGSRFSGTPRRVLYYWHTVGNRLLTGMSNMFTDLNLTDMETGYKVFRSEVFKNIVIRSERFGFEPEVTAKVAQHHFRLYEVPISYQGREYWEGKKINWKDGVAALWTIVRFNLIPDTPGDDEGFETLRRMHQLRRYNLWLLDRVRPYLGQRVLEIGAGIGNLTKHMLGRPLLVATDINGEYLRILRMVFQNYRGVMVKPLDITAMNAVEWRDLQVDTVLCFNVLEHIERDMDALRRMHDLLTPGGRLILLSPALKGLFGSLDQRLGHYRRYSRAEMEEKVKEAGFEVEDIRYLNALAVPGWFINARLLRRRRLPKLQLALFRFLFPLVRIESRLRLPFGLSLLAIGRKTGAGKEHGTGLGNTAL